MTAIVMVFEMTRDYAIIVPVIVAVALAAGVRRALVGETIYTIKLRHRGHRIPKERHINLYLVKQAQDIMESGFIVARAGTALKDAMLPDDIDDVRRHRRRTGGTYRRARSAALRTMARGPHQSGRSCREICRKQARHLPRRGPAQHGVCSLETPPRRRGGRVSRDDRVRESTTSSASSPSAPSPTRSSTVMRIDVRKSCRSHERAKHFPLFRSLPKCPPPLANISLFPKNKSRTITQLSRVHQRGASRSSRNVARDAIYQRPLASSPAVSGILGVIQPVNPGDDTESAV